jgi:hypothetical protein
MRDIDCGEVSTEGGGTCFALESVKSIDWLLSPPEIHTRQSDGVIRRVLSLKPNGSALP